MKLDDLVQGHPEAEDELKKLRDFVGYSVSKIFDAEIAHKMGYSSFEMAQKCGVKKWSGGEIPVPKVSEVVVLFRSGKKTNHSKPGLLKWIHENKDDDIIAYWLRGSAD